jgi:Protein of unknown function (DUF3037)
MTHAFEFSIVRFVPNVVRGEAVNVGVVVRDPKSHEFSFKFVPRSATVRKLAPNADSALVENFRKQLAGTQKTGVGLAGVGDPGSDAFFDRALHDFNGNLQFDVPRGMTAGSLNEATTMAYTTYVAPPASGWRPINYQAIAPLQTREKLWHAFERVHLIAPNRVGKQVEIQGRHAPWTFDLAYKNGRQNVINSVAITAETAETNLGRALVLKGMVEDVAEKHSGAIHGIAVVQRPKKGDAPGGHVAEEILRDADLEVEDIGDVDKLVDRVGQELASQEPAIESGP